MDSIRYIGPFNDSSGYASAARHNVVAMLQMGLDLTLEPVSFEVQHTTHGTVQQLINNHTRVRKHWTTNIIHLTPENWPRFIEPQKYNIGYTVWETSKLPADWIPIINSMQEVWVPSQWNREVFIESGVKIPIRVVPHTIDTKLPDATYDTSSLPASEAFKFYSIFQWTERKNPIGLLTAYLTEFTDKDNVTLFLKTYGMNWDYREQQIIKEKVRQLKVELGLHSYPPINFIGNLLTTESIYTLHKVGDCLVSPHRGEGAGLTIMEAMLFGKPVITTGWSGNLEFTKPNNSYLLDYKLVNVAGMPWGKYTSDQLWAEPSLADLKFRMRWVYDHRREATEQANRGQAYIKENHSYNKIGNLIKEHLTEIKV